MNPFERIVQNWRQYLYGLWLGGAINAAFGAGIFDLRFWVVLLPTVVLVTIFNENRFDWD